MAITPKPITERTRHIEDRSPIGTRYRASYEGDGHCYTLVAYELDPTQPRTAIPYFIGDYQFNTKRTWVDQLTDGTILIETAAEIVTDDQVLEVAPDDLEKATRARSAAMGRYQEPYRNTGDFGRVLAFEDLTTDQEVAAFHAFAEAERKLREAQWTLERVARERSERVARIADLKGSQSAAARTLGVNQSSVSRALRERPERP